MKELDFSNISDPSVGVNFEIVRDEIIDLENGKANVSSGAGAPSGGSSNDLYVDTTNIRLYVNVAGTWKYAGLT